MKILSIIIVLIEISVVGMTVLKSKRSESAAAFLQTAMDLEIYTIKRVVKFPKRYTFYISQPLANTATEIHKLVKKGNSIYPKNKHEAQKRRDCFIDASTELRSFVGLIEVAINLFSIEPNVVKQWMELVSKENRLLHAVMEKEQIRYHNLPE